MKGEGVAQEGGGGNGGEGTGEDMAEGHKAVVRRLDLICCSQRIGCEWATCSHSQMHQIRQLGPYASKYGAAGIPLATFLEALCFDVPSKSGYGV